MTMYSFLNTFKQFIFTVAVLLCVFICIVTFMIIADDSQTTVEYKQVEVESPETKQDKYNTDGFITKEDVPKQNIFEETCDSPLFNAELRLDDDPPVVPRELLAHCNKVLYNRVPKCASRMCYELFNIVAPQHNMTSIYLQRKWRFENDARNKVIKNFQRRPTEGFILTCHYLFDTFSDVLGDTGVYIQVIREPSDWLMSYLNWQRYGSNERHGTKKYFVDVSIEECIANVTCVTDKMAFAGSLSFICGQDAICDSASNSSLQKAIENIEQHYLVVGLSEDLPAYLEILEYLMPHVFSGISQVYPEIVGKFQYRSSTAQKDPVDPAAMTSLYNQTFLHRQLYEFAKTRFYKMLKAIRTLKSLQS